MSLSEVNPTCTCDELKLSETSSDGRLWGIIPINCMGTGHSSPSVAGVWTALHSSPTDAPGQASCWAQASAPALGLWWDLVYNPWWPWMMGGWALLCCPHPLSRQRSPRMWQSSPEDLKGTLRHARPKKSLVWSSRERSPCSERRQTAGKSIFLISLFWGLGFGHAEW